MSRTTATAVKNVLGPNYDSINGPTLTPFIDLANLVTTRYQALAAAEGTVPSSAELEMVERYLAAQRYCDQDPVYTSRSTLSASGSFQRLDTAIGEFARAACGLDPTGLLMGLLKGQVAGGAWAGKAESEQLTWDERN